jgi:hypothetical protein
MTAVRHITNYYTNLQLEKRRETGPRDTIRLINLLHAEWKEDWLDEFFCDLFALFTLGPAFAWSHVHLCAKTSGDVYEFSRILRKTHPSNEARMRLLLKGLKLINFNDQSDRISATWSGLPSVKATRPVAEYQYAYPDALLDTICSTFLNGIEECGFVLATPERVRSLSDDSIVKLLTQAWEQFWCNPNGFREWEEMAINRMKSRQIRN